MKVVNYELFPYTVVANCVSFKKNRGTMLKPEQDPPSLTGETMATFERGKLSSILFKGSVRTAQ
jgi:hypothetical protein